MFHNVGKKIKATAQAVFYILMLGAIIGGVALAGSDDSLIGAGVGLIAGGFFVAWFFAMLIYGFGEIIDKATAIERNTRGGEIKSEAMQREADEKLMQLESLRDKGLITEEEYRAAVEKHR